MKMTKHTHCKTSSKYRGLRLEEKRGYGQFREYKERKCNHSMLIGSAMNNIHTVTKI